MQQFILPDYLDGTKSSKNFHLQSIAMCSRLIDYMQIVDEVKVAIDFGKENPYVNGIPLREFLPFVNQDESMKIFLRTYKAYADRDSGNYLVTKNLSKALSETKLDIKCSFLPKEFTAFLDIKDLYDHDGDHIQGVFIDITQDPIPAVYLACIGLNEELDIYTVSHLNVPLEQDKSLSEVITKHKEVSSVLTDEQVKKIKDGEILDVIGNMKKEETQADYHQHLHTIFNTILYITHGSENFVVEQNEFSKKVSKQSTQRKIYTPKKFVVLGKNFSLPKEYTCGEVGVSGHWRWQPYGPQRSLIKHIYIKPHTRNYNKQEESSCPTL